MTEEINVVDENPKRFPWGMILVWGTLFLILLVVAINMKTQGPLEIGKPAPDFVLETMEGDLIALADLKGKVVLVNFWASWCLECRYEAAELQDAWEMYKPDGNVVFLGVAWEDTEKKAAAYLEEFGFTYPNGHDFGSRIGNAYRLTGVPETYIIDTEGNLAFVLIGPFSSFDHIIYAIGPLLEE